MSLLFAGLGFAVILSGAAIAVARDSVASGVLPAISGTIVEAVAGLFFVLSTRTQRVMVAFYDKLREDRRLEESLRLVPGVPDKEMASRLQVLLALQLAGVDELDSLFHQTVHATPLPADKARSQANGVPTRVNITDTQAQPGPLS
jgi:hypothetical protein